MKEALHYNPEGRDIPLGGAKGGIDCDPQDPAAYGLLVRYRRATRPYIESLWTTGEDLGLTQDLVDRAAEEAGLVSSIQAVYPLLDDETAARRRLADAFAVDLRGWMDRARRTGRRLRCRRVGARGPGPGRGDTRGRVWPCRAWAPWAQPRPASSPARASTSSPSRTSRARSRTRTGWTSTRCSRRGTPTGRSTVARCARPTRQSLGDAWLSMDAEVLVPAAVSYAIDTENQRQIGARWIVEAANMPVLPEAEELLAARGVVVLPDVVVNSGTNAWWWWTLFGDIGADADEAFAYTRRSMRDLIGRMLARAVGDGRHRRPRRTPSSPTGCR